MLQPLTNPDVLKSVLGSHKLKADKSLGQNFLICEEVPEAILLGLQDGPKLVTELGPGLGTLTQSLIGSGYIVRAIEKDDDFIKIIPTVLPKNLRQNLELIHGDLLEVDWCRLSSAKTSTFAKATADKSARQDWSIVGNIPYNLSGLIIRRLTNMQITPNRAIFLMQKEVVERLIAKEDNMSLLGLSVGLWGSATLLLHVPPTCFIPAPSVQSALVIITPHTDMLPVVVREEIIAKSKPFFQAKRKQIAHTLKTAYKKNREEIEVIAKKLNILPSARPENLTIQQWILLTDAL